jgi:hypothetical protein
MFFMPNRNALATAVIAIGCFCFLFGGWLITATPTLATERPLYLVPVVSLGAGVIP